jgi:hemerythrin-like domain-containing protein
MTAVSWPEEPFRLIATTDAWSYPTSPAAARVARLMALTHNTIFRALNAVYHQCGAVQPEKAKDVRDLAMFTTFALDFLDNHHKVEETVFFPMLEAQTRIPGLMAENIQQHRAFDCALGRLRKYIERLKTGVAFLDALELKRLIRELAEPLERHLNDEIPTLLRIGNVLDDKTIEICYKAMHAEAEGTTDPYRYVFEVLPIEQAS